MPASGRSEAVAGAGHLLRGPLPVALLFALALGVRLVYLVQVSDSPDFLMPLVDSEVYDRAARSLASGGGFSEAFFYQPFFYPLFLALVYTVFGTSIVAAKVVQAVLGAVTCVLVSELATRLFDRPTGLVAGGIVALYGPAVFFDGELLATGWAGLWSVALVWLLWRSADAPSRWAGFAVGLIGGAATITRPTFLPFLVVACVWLVVELARRDRSVMPRVLVGVATGFLVVAMPVGWISAGNTGRFQILPASGGLNLHLGNNPDPCDTLTIRPGQGWQDLITRPRREGHNGLWQENDFFRAEARRYLLSDPGGFATGLAVKTVQFVSSREIPRNLDIYLYRRWSSLLRVTVWKIGDFGFPFGILLPLAVLGVVTGWRRLPPPLLLYLVLYPLAVAVVFVSARYRVPVVPVAAIPAAAGILAVVRWVSQRGLRSLAMAAIPVVLGLLVAVIPGPFCQEQDLEGEYWFLVAAAHLRHGDRTQALTGLRRAVELEPSYFEARYQLGVMLIERGELTAAVPHLERALVERPDFAIVHRDLGLALGRLGRVDGALFHLRRAVELAPDDPRALNYLGALAAQSGDLEAALDHLERAVALDPEYPAARENLAWVRSRIEAGAGGEAAD